MLPPCFAVSGVTGSGSGEFLHCKYLVENGGEGQGSLPRMSQCHRQATHNIGDKMHIRVPVLKLCN